jgi:hypothetical protein
MIPGLLARHIPCMNNASPLLLFFPRYVRTLPHLIFYTIILFGDYSSFCSRIFRLFTCWSIPCFRVYQLFSR